jgi:hypothetical protein
MIAVNDPEQRMIYSNRFQLGMDQRLVFLAHSDGEPTADGFPRVTVKHFVKSINASTARPASLPADNTIENV